VWEAPQPPLGEFEGVGFLFIIYCLWFIVGVGKGLLFGRVWNLGFNYLGFVFNCSVMGLKFRV
jgi:hypothetical protein